MSSFWSKLFLTSASAGYDERQALARGRAWRLAFFVLAGWTLLSAVFLGQLFINGTMEKTGVLLAAVIGIALSLAAFQLCCIALDAYVQLKQNAGAQIASHGAATLIWGAFAALASFSLKSEPTMYIELCGAGYNALLFVGLVVKALFDKGREKREASE